MFARQTKHALKLTSKSDRVFGQLHLQLCQSPVPDCQPTATELSRSLPLGSGTVFLSTSHSASTLSTFCIHLKTQYYNFWKDTYVRACEVTSSLWTRKSFLLTYFESRKNAFATTRRRDGDKAVCDDGLFFTRMILGI